MRRPRRASQDLDRALTKSFFTAGEYAPENGRRSDAGKWETVLSASHRYRATSLIAPVFDVHYVAREGGANSARPPQIPYALIITIDAPKSLNLYADVLRSYPVLVSLSPRIAISM
jgi:hypothetical protein